MDPPEVLLRPRPIIGRRGPGCKPGRDGYGAGERDIAMNRTDSAAREAGDLGRSLRIWRALRRMKQSHAAELLDVSQATVSRWESGHQVPTPPEYDALRMLMAARLDGAADHWLGRLVRGTTREAHLICDLTHRLLAASPARERRWKVSASDLMGTSMWRFHTEAIAQAEARLPALGWYGEAPPEVEVVTGANDSAEVPIRRGRCRWTRLRLSDGSYARLVETETAA
jgi:transcriptional regulator with XRE-family HTH domain